MGLKGPTGTSFFFIFSHFFFFFFFTFPPVHSSLKKKEIREFFFLNPDLPTGSFFCPSGPQETIFYLRVASPFEVGRVIERITLLLRHDYLKCAITFNSRLSVLFLKESHPD